MEFYLKIDNETHVQLLVSLKIRIDKLRENLKDVIDKDYYNKEIFECERAYAKILDVKVSLEQFNRE